MTIRTAPAVAVYILGLFITAHAVDFTVNASAGRIQISPAIYGRDNCLSDDPSSPTPAATLNLYRDAGLRFIRDGGGNNATKYNWQKKISSHPDWYNNVYAHDWDYGAQTMISSLPGVQGMWSLQLLGKVAGNTRNNFNDWAYNGATWAPEVVNNWAGGGGPAAGDGNPALYLQDWPADSTCGILTKWFSPAGQGGLALDSSRLRYWEMDNEPEIWDGTHDDVVTDTITAEAYLAKYFAVAKKARALFPGIRLVGPVFTNEWQWWNWNGHFVGSPAVPWMEYFIKRVSEEQRASGIRLLDVVCFHFYQNYDGSAAAERNMTQISRIWYDTSYSWPWANGSKAYPSGWNETRRKQFIFGRVESWLNQYLGTGHGVSVGLSETGFFGTEPTPALAAIWYATHLGTFADNGVALFSPWNWYKGQWEVMHLFSRYAKPTRVQSVSALDTVVSAYSSVSGAGDSVTVILVNRDKGQAQQARIQTSGFTMGSGPFDVLELANLNATNETFQSHTVNALARRTVTPAAGVVTLTLPAYSVTAVLLSGRGASVLHPDVKPENGTRSKKKTGMMYNLDGRRMRPTATKHSFEDASGVKVSNRAQLYETTVVK